MMAPQRQPSPVDLHVGGRIRTRRLVKGLSEKALAGALDLSVRQIQAYERGDDRVNPSNLFVIATVLQVPVSYFFDGLPEPNHEPGTPSDDRAIRSFLGTAEGLELARRFLLIPEGELRDQVMELVRSLGEAAPPTSEQP